VVADVGTAATIDVVAADGGHRGGFIVPGPELMVRSLLRSTSDLAPRHAAGGAAAHAAGFADNTRDAIERGCRLALAALIERCFGDAALEAAAGPPCLLVTGGAATEVLPYLRIGGPSTSPTSCCAACGNWPGDRFEPPGTSRSNCATALVYDRRP